MLAFLGLSRPRRLERAIPALLAALGLLIVAGAAARLALGGELTTFGPRAAYFAWLAGLLVAGLGLVRWPWLAWSVLALAGVDLAWGVGSYELRHLVAGETSLLPPDRAEPARFQWHALLQAVPIPGLHLTSATGLEIRHSTAGTRGADPAPGSLAGRAVIATFGGSTTYDIGTAEGSTWSDRLAAALGPDRAFVVNHGVPGYTTVELLIQTTFYPDTFGVRPRCAIYYVGWNDLRNAHIPDLDPAYADFHLPSQVDSLGTRRVGGSHVTVSPLLTVVLRLLSAEIDTVRYAKDPYALAPMSGDDPRLDGLYRAHLEAISALNRQRGVRTVWVGQLLDRSRLQGDGRYGWLPRVRDRDLWPLEQHFNALLGETARRLGDLVVEIPEAAFGPDDFVDIGHFSVQGSRRFADFLAPVVRDACL
ncbi:MAG: hypothetical protein U1E23_11530 [Reyranellaceae bacterium]